MRFLLWADRRHTLRFAPLQGATARGLLGPLPELPDALVYWRENRPLMDSSSAVLGVLRDLGLPWSAAALLLLIPKPLRDWLYQVLATRRYRLFGKYESCPVPDEGQKDQFLD